MLVQQTKPTIATPTQLAHPREASMHHAAAHVRGLLHFIISGLVVSGILCVDAFQGVVASIVSDRITVLIERQHSR